MTLLDVLPLFVKGGAVIPMQPAMIYIGEKPADTITFDIFPWKTGNFEWYEDDGLSLQYQQGQYAVTKIKVADGPESITVDVYKPQGKFVSSTLGNLAKVHMDAAPVCMVENGKAIEAVGSKEKNGMKPGWYYDAQEKICWVKTGFTNTTGKGAGNTFDRITIFKK